jgi:hypothetical protein
MLLQTQKQHSCDFSYLNRRPPITLRGVKLPRIIGDPAIIDIIEDDDDTIRLLLLFGALSIFVQRVLAAYPRYK